MAPIPVFLGADVITDRSVRLFRQSCTQTSSGGASDQWQYSGCPPLGHSHWGALWTKHRIFRSTGGEPLFPRSSQSKRSTGNNQAVEVCICTAPRFCIFEYLR